MFEKHYRDQVDRVYWYLYLKLGNQQEVEDLTSQAFLQAFQAFPHLRDHKNFAAWVFTIARNLAMDHFRRAKKISSIDPEQLVSAEPDLLSSAMQSERSRLIQALISLLPKPDQDLLQLRFVAQLTFREMAEVLRKNESTLKRDYYRILAQLKDQMEDA